MNPFLQNIRLPALPPPVIGIPHHRPVKSSPAPARGYPSEARRRDLAAPSGAWEAPPSAVRVPIRHDPSPVTDAIRHP